MRHISFRILGTAAANALYQHLKLCPGVDSLPPEATPSHAGVRWSYRDCLTVNVCPAIVIEPVRNLRFNVY